MASETHLRGGHRTLQTALAYKAASTFTSAFSSSFKQNLYCTLEIAIGGEQTFEVVIDTGSALLAVPCAECDECGPHAGAQRFAPLESTSARSVSCVTGGSLCSSCSEDGEQCLFQRRFSEGSEAHGTYYVDAVSLPHAASFAPVLMPLGCLQKEGGALYSQQASGVIGLSQSPLSLIAALVRERVIDRNAFSLCFGVNGGVATFGGRDPRLSLPLEAYGSRTAGATTMSISDQGFYLLDAASVRMAAPAGAHSEWLSLTDGASGGGTERWPPHTSTSTSSSSSTSTSSTPPQVQVGLPVVVDTGSSFTYLPRHVVMQVADQLAKYCWPAQSDAGAAPRCPGTPVPSSRLQPLQSLCVDFGTHAMSTEHIDAALAQLPAVELQFGDGSVMQLRPEHLFVRAVWPPAAQCLGLYPSEHSDGGPGRAILGANALHGYDVTFDTQGAQLQWVPSDCDPASAPPRLAFPAADDAAPLPPSSLLEQQGAVSAGLREPFDMSRLASLPLVRDSRAASSNTDGLLGQTAAGSTTSTGAAESEAAVLSRLLLYGIVLGAMLVLSYVFGRRAVAAWKRQRGSAYSAVSVPAAAGADDDDDGEEEAAEEAPSAVKTTAL